MKENVTLSDLKAGDVLIYIGANCSQFKRELTYTVLWDNLPYELIIVDDRRNVIPIKKLNLVNFKLHPQQPERLLSEADLVPPNRFECIEGFYSFREENLYTKGKVYECKKKGQLINDAGFYDEIYESTLNRHFKLISQTAQEEVKEEYRSKHGWIYSKNILHASGSPTFTKKDKHGFSTFATIDNVIDIETSLLQQEVEKLRELLKESKRFCGGSLQAKIDNQLNK